MLVARSRSFRFRSPHSALEGPLTVNCCTKARTFEGCTCTPVCARVHARVRKGRMRTIFDGVYTSEVCACALSTGAKLLEECRLRLHSLGLDVIKRLGGSKKSRRTLRSRLAQSKLIIQSLWTMVSHNTPCHCPCC